MATKYHISDGRIMRCTAGVRPCPLGGQHYATKAEAKLNAQPLDLPSAPALSEKAETSFKRMAANENYAKFLRSFEVRHGKSSGGPAMYHDADGRFVSRTTMIEEVNRLASSKLFTEREIDAPYLRNDLYRADASFLHQRKLRFRAAHDAYRAENGPAVRPNFTQLLADNEAKRSSSTVERAVEIESARQQDSRVQGSKRLRNAQEDVAISFGKRQNDSTSTSPIFGEQVPAVAIGSALGELVVEGKESISDFFADAGDGVRSLFNRN